MRTQGPYPQLCWPSQWPCNPSFLSYLGILSGGRDIDRFWLSASYSRESTVLLPFLKIAGPLVRSIEPWKQEFVSCPLLLIMGVILVAHRGNVKSMKARSPDSDKWSGTRKRVAVPWLVSRCTAWPTSPLSETICLFLPRALRTSAVWIPLGGTSSVSAKIWLRQEMFRFVNTRWQYVPVYRKGHGLVKASWKKGGEVLTAIHLSFKWKLNTSGIFWIFLRNQ